MTKYDQIPQMIRAGESIQLSRILVDLRDYIISFMITSFHMSEDLAQDYAQYALFQLARKSQEDTLEPSGIASFMITVARNKYFSDYRHRKKRLHISNPLAEGYETSAGNQVTDELQAAQTLAALTRSAARLYRGQAQVFRLLIELPDMPINEAADHLGIPINTYKTNKFRMQERLLQRNPAWGKYSPQKKPGDRNRREACLPAGDEDQ